LIDGTNKLNYFEMSVPKKVTAGWARRDVMCLALSCLFLSFEQRSYCPASISRTSWPPTPAKTNSGTLTCYTFDYEAPSVYLKMYIFIAVVFVYNFFTHFGVDLFFYTAMVQVDTQCDILGDTLRNIDAISEEDDREELGQDKKMHKILIESVRHYNVILK
jgi:hypothetical protein